jgi:hypothetical protein
VLILCGNLLFEDAAKPTENPVSFDRKATGKNFVPSLLSKFFRLELFDTDEENLILSIGQFRNSRQMLNA